ncbi:MAG TPA: phosphopantetheine-binding protein [Actinoplanes sp.]|nr:phosphopantetheine-binding protein [Actinoplanes sp.]
MNSDQVRAVVRRAWEDALSAEVDDSANFFAIGGHSFMAIKIIALLDAALPVPIPMMDLFDHPVLTDFADTVAARINRSAVAD